MSRVHCRCRGCQARKVLKRLPETYDRQPKCWSCGARDWRPDPWMNRRNTRAMGCMCSGYAWAGMMTGAMHRRGSLRCYYRANGEPREYGDADYFIDTNYGEFV